MPLTEDHSKAPIGTVGELVDLLSKFPRWAPIETAYGDSMTRGAFEGLFQHEGNEYVVPGTVVLVSDWDNLRNIIVDKHQVFRG